MRNYELPISFETLMEGKREINTCPLRKSIGQNINLIITTKYKEHRFDEDYGCEVWDMDFELVLNENAWKEKIVKSVINSVKKNERRLEDLEVGINITEEEFFNWNKTVKGIRKKVTISLSGTIKETGEMFSFNTRLFLNPISFH